MALQTHVDSITSTGDSKWWKLTSSGGGIGAGLGAIIGTAIAAGTAAAKGGGTSGASTGGSSTGMIAPGIVKPGTGTIPGTEGATAPKEPTQPNLDDLKETGNEIINAAPSIPKTEGATDNATAEEEKKISGSVGIHREPPPRGGDKDIIITPEETPDIKDETSTNVEQAIDNSDTLAMLKQLRDEQWAREDAIRAETQKREDTAFSRGIADMRRAGVNVNLVGAQPAESGGGITNATGVDGGIYSAEVGKYVSLLETALNNEFKGNENTKDRITETIGKLVQAIVVGLMK